LAHRLARDKSLEGRLPRSQTSRTSSGPALGSSPQGTAQGTAAVHSGPTSREGQETHP
jgi:hypothetical protein